MSEQIIFQKELGNGEQLRVTASDFKGKTYIHFRKYWQDEAMEWKPGKGISAPFGPDFAIMCEAAQAMIEYSNKKEG